MEGSETSARTRAARAFRIGRIPLLVFIALSATLVLSCHRVVRWEEDVLLNTGEHLTLKRWVLYRPQSGGGNPFAIAVRPSGMRSMSFNWRGKDYSLSKGIAMMVLAISPQSTPVLVARAESGG